MGALLGLISDFLIEEYFEAYALMKGGKLSSCQSNRNVLAKAISCSLDPLLIPCRVSNLESHNTLVEVSERLVNRNYIISRKQSASPAI